MTVRPPRSKFVSAVEKRLGRSLSDQELLRLAACARTLKVRKAQQQRVYKPRCVVSPPLPPHHVSPLTNHTRTRCGYCTCTCNLNPQTSKPKPRNLISARAAGWSWSSVNPRGLRRIVFALILLSTYEFRG